MAQQRQPRQTPKALKALSRNAVLFIREYLVDLNATQAAIRAGYAVGGAAQRAYILMQDERISRAITEEMAKRAARVELTADSVLSDLKRIAHLAEADGQYAAAVRAKELLGRHLRLWSETVHVTGTVTLESLVKATAAQTATKAGE